MKPITITGGGLAGLSLGIALRRHGVPVTIHEAGSYPRHRVCGEFICGVKSSTLEALDIAPYFNDARANRTTSWYFRGRKVLQRPLPRAAIGLSRHALDARLAAAFEASGGVLLTQSRVNQDEDHSEGRIRCTGRRTTMESPWLGLKCHVVGMELHDDLEIHVGRNSYCGASRVEGDRVNVCGLFRRQPDLTAPRSALLGTYLRASGLETLADRIAAAEVDPGSHCGVAHLAFQGHWRSTPGLALGDHIAHIPPFTGNGMSMAFESAEAVLASLVVYAADEATWPETVTRAQRALNRRFKRRLGNALLLHPMIHHPLLQPLTLGAGRLGILPFKSLFSLTHE
jgi:flavin-dependent dehydrogenase